ncbi:type II secretion system F family protein [Niveibacterium sp. SC-1]|uniref:type II secretion system F family protein n=1 Tax=Niveibacterium sp. SC-1 TaxID=3135646 RepID=UPI00311F8A1D
MPAFSYRALDAQGQLVRGRMSAPGMAELEQRLQQAGLAFINGEAVRELSWSRPPRRELMHFCFHLEQLLRAGVPILDALQDLQEAAAHPRFRAATAEVLQRIHGGSPFSEALASQPAVFDRMFCALIRAGETTGRLPEVLAQIHETRKREDELAAYTRRLAIYPAVVLLVVCAALIVSLSCVVPELAKLFASTGQTLPASTRLLVALSELVTQHYGWLLGGLALAVAAGAATLTFSAAARLALDRAKLQAAVIGPVHRKIVLARFAALFAMSYAAGITIPETLRIAQDAAGNRAIRRALKQVETRVSEGQQLTQAFAGAALFPPLVIRMLRVGETTGALDAALANVGYFYERDVRESILRLQAMLEPLLTVVLGGLLMWVMLSVLGPIYDIITRMTP